MLHFATALVHHLYFYMWFVKMLSEAVARRADDSGKIRTIGGRLCHFDLWEPHGFGIKKPLKHADALREHGPGIKRAYTY